MKKLTFVVIFLGFLFISKAQITKGNWLVGGNGNFSIINVLDETTHYLQLSPNIGYFFFYKFAAGIKPSYVYSFGKSEGTSAIAKNSGFYLGPFARYYFLSTDKPYNILLEANYQHGWEKKADRYTTTNYSLNNFSFAAGPAIYFNSSVGLELLVGYVQSKYVGETFHDSRLQVGIGLQVHLERE